MKSLPPDKRNKLIMVLLATAALISLVFFLLIQPQKADNRRLAATTLAENKRLQEIITSIKTRADATATMANALQQLNDDEQDVASGDLYAWTYDTVRRFKTAYHVEIPSVGQPVLGEVDLVPNFPYKQLRVSLNGTAYYHDLGKFIADLENKHPHIRVLNVIAEPATGVSVGEHLNFRMDIIALTKPNS